jgi:hypothetical protein
MKEMELLRELAQQTPLPAPAELDSARARLAAAIATDPATYATAAAQVATDQPCPSAGDPAGPLRPPPPASVLTAARFMHAGAVGTAAYLIVALPFIGDIQGKMLGHRLTATPLVITLVILVGVAAIALWLWMARATSQGKNWARILCTVLFGLATLQLLGNHGLAQVFFAALTWLTGLPSVWLLWRPASSAFFKSAKAARSLPPSQISGP